MTDEHEDLNVMVGDNMALSGYIRYTNMPLGRIKNKDHGDEMSKEKKINDKGKEDKVETPPECSWTI